MYIPFSPSGPGFLSTDRVSLMLFIYCIVLQEICFYLFVFYCWSLSLLSVFDSCGVYDHGCDYDPFQLIGNDICHAFMANMLYAKEGPELGISNESFFLCVMVLKPEPKLKGSNFISFTFVEYCPYE